MNPFKYIYRTIVANISYFNARIKAEKQAKLYGYRQYVIVLKDRRLVVGDKKGISVLQWKTRDKDTKPKRPTVTLLQQAAIYYTAYSDGNGRMQLAVQNERRKMYVKMYIHKD